MAKQTDDEPTNEAPLAYMLRIMRDKTKDPRRRDRMAIAAASYLHKKRGDTGKKEEEQERADGYQIGKFSPGRPPLRSVGK